MPIIMISETPARLLLEVAVGEPAGDEHAGDAGSVEQRSSRAFAFLPDSP